MIGSFNRQRFPQYSPEDSANFYIATSESAKKPMAMFPTMGRKHVRKAGSNALVFSTEARGEFKTVKYMYIVEGATVFKLDDQYVQVPIGSMETSSGDVYFTFLVVNAIVYACFIDTQFIYIYQESGTGFTGVLEKVTDPRAPGNFTQDGIPAKPGFIAAFGSRLVVSVAESSQFVLSAPNLVGVGASTFNPALCFTNAAPQVQIFAYEDGIIRQMGVLYNTLYILCDYITGLWSNTPAVFSGTDTTFPFKKNTTYDWNFGIANPKSLDIDFGYMFFLAQNSDGLLQFMASNGGFPERISTRAVDTLLQNYTNSFGAGNPFLSPNSNGFLYQYENTIFYRMSGGFYTGNQILDEEQTANSIEFSMEAKEWHRCIEANGERSRIQQHVYFGFKHLVTVTGDGTIYEMSGHYYTNDIRNPEQEDPQADDAFTIEPFRYERVTPIIYEEDYAEFETEYVQIDFVFGESNISYSTGPFNNAIFIIDEEAGEDNEPQFMITESLGADGDVQYILAEQGNTPQLNDTTYNTLYKPNIELLFSDDSGISFQSADIREFSQMGQYQWRMRWYQLGQSRNRVYKLVAVSPVPIVILGAVMNTRRSSGGAN